MVAPQPAGHSYRLAARCRISESAAFRRALRSPARFQGPVAIFVADNGLPQTRIGIVVARRHGPAVWRNRFKRLVREAFRLARPRLPLGVDIVCMPGQGECEMRRILALLLEHVPRLAQRTRAGPPPAKR